MELLTELRKEFDHEYQTTKKFFDIFPEGKNDYKPHEKSMKLLPLATHIAEIFGWPGFMISTSELDFADGGERPKIETKEDLIKNLDENYQKSKEALAGVTVEDLEPTWALKMKGQELASWTKYGAIRHSLNQATHHRAQLGVYYRLNDIPLPGSYGPSADDASF